MSSKDTLAAQWTTWVRVLTQPRPAPSGSMPRPGCSMSPAMNRNFRARAPVMPIRFSRSAPALRRLEDLHDLLRLRVADRLRPHHRHDLLDAPVARGLGEDLLAHEAGGAREQHLQARVAAPRAQRGGGVALQALHARLHLLLAQVGGLAELEVRRRGPSPRGGAWPGPRRSGRPATAAAISASVPPTAFTAADARVHGLLAAGELDQPAGHELRAHLDRMEVAVGVDEQLVGVDRPRQLGAGALVDARDVAGRRGIAGLARRRAPARAAGTPHGTRPALRRRAGYCCAASRDSTAYGGSGYPFPLSGRCASGGRRRPPRPPAPGPGRSRCRSRGTRRRTRPGARGTPGRGS